MARNITSSDLRYYDMKSLSVLNKNVFLPEDGGPPSAVSIREWW
jgi:hypothetical protein